MDGVLELWKSAQNCRDPYLQRFRTKQRVLLCRPCYGLGKATGRRMRLRWLLSGGFATRCISGYRRYVDGVAEFVGSCVGEDGGEDQLTAAGRAAFAWTSHVWCGRRRCNYLASIAGVCRGMCRRRTLTRTCLVRIALSESQRSALSEPVLRWWVSLGAAAGFVGCDRSSGSCRWQGRRNCRVSRGQDQCEGVIWVSGVVA